MDSQTTNKMGRSFNSGSVTGRELYDAWQSLRNGSVCVSDFVGLNHLCAVVAELNQWENKPQMMVV